MDIENIKYKIRSVMYDITSAEFMSKVYFLLTLKYRLDLKNPLTLNEKMQWYKLNYCQNNKEIIECADKYLLQNFLRRNNLESTIIDLYGAWDSADEIDFDKLPNQFVLKCNHGCRYNIICNNKKTFNKENAKRKLNIWMNQDFGKLNAEPHDSKIKRKIICEEYVHTYNNKITDYKIHCFNKKPMLIEVCEDRNSFGVAAYEFMDINYNNIDKNGASIEKPPHLQEMIVIAKEVCKHFPYVRVDFYDLKNKPVIGELTFVHGAGLSTTISKKQDIEFGKYFDLSKIKQ